MEENLTSEPQGLTAFAFGEAIYNERRVVAELLDTIILPAIKGKPFKTPRDKLFTELFMRVEYWLITLEMIVNANGFHAVVACHRAMFEMTVDLTLMHFAREKYTPEKMLAWEESARLNASKHVERYYKDRRKQAPSKFDPQMEFIKKQAARVEALRSKHGFLNKRGQPYHPGRWTGADLGSDAREAQKVSPTSGELHFPFDLEELYATQHSHACWHVHGSGALGLRFLPPERLPLIGAEAMRWCLEFAVRCAQLLLVERGLFGADAKAGFRKCQIRRTAMLTTVLRHHDPTYDADNPARLKA